MNFYTQKFLYSVCNADVISNLKQPELCRTTIIVYLVSDVLFRLSCGNKNVLQVTYLHFIYLCRTYIYISTLMYVDLLHKKALSSKIYTHACSTEIEETVPHDSHSVHQPLMVCASINSLCFLKQKSQ